jgi:hypothetical protein
MAYGSKAPQQTGMGGGGPKNTATPRNAGSPAGAERAPVALRSNTGGGLKSTGRKANQAGQTPGAMGATATGKAVSTGNSVKAVSGRAGTAGGAAVAKKPGASVKPMGKARETVQPTVVSSSKGYKPTKGNQAGMC